MKTRFLKRTALAVTILSILPLATHAQSRMERITWADRSLELSSNSNSDSMNSSIERFWNIPESTANSTETIAPHRSTKHQHTSTPKNNTLDQKESTRERRGYLGINLFNLIPIIDIEHGHVSRDSNDRVTIKK